MRRNGMILVVFLLMLATVLSAGCTGRDAGPNPKLTNTYSAAAVDLHKQGFDAYDNGNYTIALDFYNRSIAADSNYTRAWIDKGIVLMRLNRTEEAISVYDVVLARENYLAEIWNSRGEALMANGNYTAARESFDKAIEIAPNYTKAKENRELALKKL